MNAFLSFVFCFSLSCQLFSTDWCGRLEKRSECCFRVDISMTFFFFMIAEIYVCMLFMLKSVYFHFSFRFLFLLLGPAGKAPQYHEIGRSIATLMTDEVIKIPFEVDTEY